MTAFAVADALIAISLVTLAALIARVHYARRADGTRIALSPEKRRGLIVASQEQQWRNGQL